MPKYDHEMNHMNKVSIYNYCLVINSLMELSLVIMNFFYCLPKIQIIDIVFTLDQGCFLCLFIDNASLSL